MANAQKIKGKWKRDVNYISHVVSDINQKMEHIVKELRGASFSLDHLADVYTADGKNKKYSGFPDEYDSYYSITVAETFIKTLLFDIA